MKRKKIKNSIVEAAIIESFKNNEQPDPQEVLAVASFKSLNTGDWCGSLEIKNILKEVLFVRQTSQRQKQPKAKP